MLCTHFTKMESYDRIKANPLKEYKGKHMTSNGKKSIYNIIAGVSNQIVVLIAGLLLPRLILVRFGSEVNGFLGSITQIINYLTLLEAGVGVSSLQALYQPVANGDRTSINQCMTLTQRFYRKTGFFHAAIILTLAWGYPILVQSDIPLQEIMAIIVFSGLAGVFHYWMSGKYKLLLEADGRKYVLLNISTWITLIANSARLFCLLIGMNLVVVQGSFCMISSLQAIWICWYTRKYYPWLNYHAEVYGKRIEQRYSILIHQISSLIFESTDVLLLTFFTNLKVVSVYTMYNMVVNMVSNLVSQIANGFTYKLGQLYHTDYKQFLRWHHFFEIVNLTVAFTCFSVAYVFMLPFLRLYTQGITDVQYIDPLLPLLFIVIRLLSSGRTVTGSAINYAGHFKKTQWNSVLESVINLTVSLLCIPRFGIYGVLFGTIAALLYRMNDIILYSSKYILKISPWNSYRRWLTNFLVFTVVVAFNYFYPVYVNNYLQMLLYAMVWGICIAGLYLLTVGVTDKAVFTDLFCLLRRKKQA